MKASNAQRPGLGARKRAARRALDFLIACSEDECATREIGEEMLFCLYNTAVTSADSKYSADAWAAGASLSWRWYASIRRLKSARISRDPNALLRLIFGLFAASRFGCLDAELVAGTVTRLNALSLRALLGFNPRRSAPLQGADVCRCGMLGHRRATVCSSCGRELVINDAYEIWQHALVVTHAGECLYTTLGTPYRLVAAWRDSMIPYISEDTERDGTAFDCFYAVSHLLYTLTDYGVYMLPGDALHAEQVYLREMLARAIRNDDQEMVSEAAECLSLFSTSANEAKLGRSSNYLLDRQLDGGSWGGDDWYDRFHRAWVGFDALRDWVHPGGERSRRWIGSTLKRANRV
jgi:hypothetical protein